MAQFLGTIINNTGFDLHLVDTMLRVNTNVLEGDRQHWIRKPPAHLAPGAKIDPYFDCLTKSIFEDVDGSVRYEGRDGDTTLFELTCSWAVYWSPRRAMARWSLKERVEKVVNCYQTPQDKHIRDTRKLTVAWQLRDWPD